MSWQLRREVALRLFEPEVSRFMAGALQRLERENVVDAPGVIHGVLRLMRLSDSSAVRSAVPRAEQILKWALVPPVRGRGA